jgi:DNA polymerase elongation subunit (family B)
MIKQSLEKILFMDIETVGCQPNYKTLKKVNKELAYQFELYEDHFKRKYAEEAESTIDQLFENKAALTPEFAKIVCVSFAFVVSGEVRVQSFSGEDEKVLLLGVKDILERVHTKDYTLCGHNIKNFDIPTLEKRMIINGISLPKILPAYDVKPWEMKVIDTKEIWACGAFGSIGTLELMCVSLGIDSPKNMEVTGNKVHEAYWTKKDIDGITDYCEKDAVTLVEVIMNLKKLN